ncbi:unnamed protein product [Orchesella dallaii]|uniref:Uncharacterized protein n=1 Tax=Orchesella dallaii TaxID=48710 RepID=A0ABP1S001_9HEXA
MLTLKEFSMMRFKPKSTVNRLYPDLALVETENGESNASINVSKSYSVNKALEDGKSAEGSKQTECGESMVEEQDDENDYDDTGDYGNEDDDVDEDDDNNDGDSQAIRHNFDTNASTLGEFHHWLNLLTHEEARNLLAVQRNEEFKDSWIQRQKWHDKKTWKRFRRGCKMGETVSKKYERRFNDIVETTARNERLIGEIPNTKTDEFVKIMKEIWLQHQNERKLKNKTQKSNIHTRSMAPLVDSTIQVPTENPPIHTNQSNLEAILPIASVSPQQPPMLLPDGISPQETQSQRILSNSSSRRPSPSSSTASTVVPDDNQLESTYHSR